MNRRGVLQVLGWAVAAPTATKLLSMSQAAALPNLAELPVNAHCALYTGLAPKALWPGIVKVWGDVYNTDDLQEPRHDHP